MAEKQNQNVFAVIGVHPTTVLEICADDVIPIRCANWRRTRGWSRSAKPALIIIVSPAAEPDNEKGKLASCVRYKARRKNRLKPASPMALTKTSKRLCSNNNSISRSKSGLNVVIHQRDAWDDTLKVLEPYTGKVPGASFIASAERSSRRRM